jgi:hypothetical protein
VVFGLADLGRVDRLTVPWPSGRTETWSGDTLGVDRYVRLTEGDGNRD